MWPTSCSTHWSPSPEIQDILTEGSTTFSMINFIFFGLDGPAFPPPDKLKLHMVTTSFSWFMRLFHFFPVLAICTYEVTASIYTSWSLGIANLVYSTWSFVYFHPHRRCFCEGCCAWKTFCDMHSEKETTWKKEYIYIFFNADIYNSLRESFHTRILLNFSAQLATPVYHTTLPPWGPWEFYIATLHGFA